MKLRSILTRANVAWPAGLTIAIFGLTLYGAHGATDIIISQKGRQFHPLTVDINRGDSLMIVNDDGDLVHHAYVESEAFSFDSGDQQPGSRTRITFPVSGDFKVLCGIHPKMKMTVHVH